MPRSSIVWTNTHALARAVHYARQAGAPDGELQGAERALKAAEGRNDWRFTMLIQEGYWPAWLAIEATARHVKYSQKLLAWILAHVEPVSGCVYFEPDELAAELGIPRNLFYSALLDLEAAEPGPEAITRLLKGRSLRGVELTARLHRKKQLPNPRRERRARAIERAAA